MLLTHWADNNNKMV